MEPDEIRDAVHTRGGNPGHIEPVVVSHRYVLSGLGQLPPLGDIFQGKARSGVVDQKNCSIDP